MPWKTSDLLVPTGAGAELPQNAREAITPKPVAEPDWVPEKGQYGFEKPQITALKPQIAPLTPQVTPAAPTVGLKPAQPGPGVMGDSWGMLSPEQGRADLAARRKQYDDISGRLTQFDKLIAQAPNPYVAQGLRAQRAALAADLPDLKQLTAMEAGTAPLATKTPLRAGAESAIKGAGETLIALPEMAGIVAGYLAPGQVDDNALLQWSQGAKDWVRTQFPGDAARQGDFSQQLASGLGQIATFYGTGALAALIKAGPKVGAAVVAALGGSATGAAGFEEATKELKKAQADAAARGDAASVTEFDRLLKTLGYTGVGLTEAVPVARTLGRAVPNPATRLEQRVIAGLEGAGEEALQESGSQLAQNLITQGTTDPNRATLEGVAEGGAVGGVLGGLMGAALPGRFTPPIRDLTPTDQDGKLPTSTTARRDMAIAGPKAKTAPTSELAQAQLLEEQGVAPEQIWQQTRWFKGGDGAWRFELTQPVDVKENKVKFKRTFNWKNEQYEDTLINYRGSLNNLLDASELIQSYPSLKQVKVTTNQERGTHFDPKTKTINVNPFSSEDNNRPKTIQEFNAELQHEIQHFIQQEEGFAFGGTSDTAGKRLSQAQEKVTELLKSAGGNIKPVLTELSERISKARKTLDRWETGGHVRPEQIDAYNRLIGEVEAENVRGRSNLTQSQRLSSFPPSTESIPRAEQFAPDDVVSLTPQNATLVDQLINQRFPALKEIEGEQFIKIIDDNAWNTLSQGSLAQAIKQKGLDQIIKALETQIDRADKIFQNPETYRQQAQKLLKFAEQLRQDYPILGPKPGYVVEHLDQDNFLDLPPSNQGIAERNQYALKDVVKKGINQLRAPVSLEATDPNYVRTQAKMLLKAGRAITVPLESHSQLFAAARALGPMIPANVPVMALTKVESLSGNKVRATYAAENGRTKTITLTQDELFSSRAFVETDNAGRSTMHFTRFNRAEALDSRVVGELWHETVHALRRQNLLWGEDYARLLSHADTLRVLDVDFRDFLRAIKSPKWEDAPSGVSIRELYEDLYADEFREDPSGLAEAVAEEGIAHMLELAQHGAVDISAVSDVLDRIKAGELTQRPGSPDLAAPVFWAKTSEQVTKEAINKLTYEVMLGGGGDFNKFKKSYPAVAIQIEEYLMNTGFDLQDIKAIKNGNEIVGFELNTNANIDFFDTNGNAYTELDELLYEKGLIDVGATFEPEPESTPASGKQSTEQVVLNWLNNLEDPNVKSWMQGLAGWDGMGGLNLQSGYPPYVLQYKVAEIWDQDPIKALKLVAKKFIEDNKTTYGGIKHWVANAARVMEEINKEEEPVQPASYAAQLTEAVKKLTSEEFAPIGVSQGVGLKNKDPEAYQTMTEVLGKNGGYLQLISKVMYPYQGTPTQIGWKIDSNLGDHYINYGTGELKATKAELVAAHSWLFEQQETKPEPTTDGFLAEQPLPQYSNTVYWSDKMFPVKIGDAEFWPMTPNSYFKFLKEKYGNNEYKFPPQSFWNNLEHIGFTGSQGKSGWIAKFNDGDIEYYPENSDEAFKLLEVTADPNFGNDFEQVVKLGFETLESYSKTAPKAESVQKDQPGSTVADLIQFLETVDKGSTPTQQSAWDFLETLTSLYDLKQDPTHIPWWVQQFKLDDLWAKDPIAAFEKTVEIYFNKYTDEQNTPVFNVVKEMLKSAPGYKSGVKSAPTEGTPDVTVGNVTAFPVNKEIAQKNIQATHKDEYPDAYFDSLDKIILVQIGKDNSTGMKFAYVVQDNKGIEELITFAEHKIYPFKKGDLYEIYNPTDVLSVTEAAKQLLKKTPKTAAPKAGSTMEDYKELLNTKLSNIGTDAFGFLYNIAGAWNYDPNSPPHWVDAAGANELWKTDVINAVLKAVQYYTKNGPGGHKSDVIKAAQALENAVGGAAQQPSAPATQPSAPSAPKVSTIGDILNFVETIEKDQTLSDGIKSAINNYIGSYELKYYYGQDGKKDATYIPYGIKDAGQQDLWKTDPLQALINAAQKQAASPYGNDDVNFQEALELIQTKAAKYKPNQKILPAKHLGVADAIKEIGEDFGEVLPDLATKLADLATPKNLWAHAPDFMATGNETAAFAELLKEEFIDNENPAYESALEEQIILKLYYDLHEKTKPPFSNPSDAIKAAPQIIQDEAKKNGGFISKEFLEAWAPDSLEVFNYTNRLTPGEGNWVVAHAIHHYLLNKFTEEELSSESVKTLLSGFLPEPVPFAPPTPWALKKAEANNPEPWDLDPENFNPPRFQTPEAARPYVSKFTRNILNEILQNEAIKKKYAKGVGNTRKAQISIITGYANQNKSTLTQSVYNQLLEIAAGLQPTPKDAPIAPEGEAETAAPVPVPPLLTNDFTKRTFTFSGKAGGGSKPKEIWTDEFGKEYLFKPVQAGKSYLADAEIFGGKIAQLINPELSPAIFPMTLNDRYGSLQQFLPSEGDISNTPVENLSWADIKALMRHHVVDYLISNHDGHAKQFLRGPDGIIGIDKGQAFKYFGKDKLALDYHPNEPYGEQEPIYNKLWRAFKEGKLDKQLAEATGGQFAELEPVQQRIKEIDAELAKIADSKKKHAEADFVIELELREKSPFLPSSQPSVSEDYIEKMTAFIKQIDAAITEPFNSAKQMPDHIRAMIESDSADTLRELFHQYFGEITSLVDGTSYENYGEDFALDPDFFSEVEESFRRAITDIVVNYLGKTPHNNKFTNTARFTESGSAKAKYLDGTWLKEFANMQLLAAVKRDRLGPDAYDPQLEQKLKDERAGWANKVQEFEKAKDTVFFEPVMAAIRDVDAKLSNELFTQLLEPYAKGRFKDPVRREAFLDYALYRKNHLGPKFWKFFLEITDPRRRAKNGAVTDHYQVDVEIKTDPTYSPSPELTGLERNAIGMYSGSAYQPLNSALKLKSEKVFENDGKINLDYLKHAASGEILSRALKKLPAYTGTVYRGQQGSSDIEQFKAGKLWTSKGFFSTSYAEDSAFGGDIKFVIKSLTGRNIEKYSNFPGEKEILFMPETVFLISKIIVTPKPYSGELYTIFMEEQSQVDWNKLDDSD